MIHTDERLLEQAAGWREAGRKVAVATVVSTWGSSPRPAGSMLIVDEAGQMQGSVSGGCIEGAVIREAMRQKTMAALGRLVLSKHERVIALEPYGKGLLGTTLRYPYEVRDAKDYFGDLPELALARDMLTLATQIVESKVADFDPKSFRDRYEEVLLEH